MKDIVLEKKDGTLLPLNHKNPLRRVISGTVQEELMGTETLSMEVESVLPIDFEVGDRIKVYQKYYYLNTLPTVERKGGRHLLYSVTMESTKYFMSHVLLTNAFEAGAVDVNETDFTFTGDMSSLMTMICQNMNRIYGEGVWTWEETDTGVDSLFSPAYDEVHTVSFSSQNTLSALTQVAELWDADFRVEETSAGYVIQVGRYGQDIYQYDFSYGKGNGLYSLSRTKAQENSIVTRLYAFGSKQNIGADYRGGHRRLGLPLSSEDDRIKNGLYIQDDAAVEKYGMVEGAVIWEDIYPHREGVVSAVTDGDVCKFSDADMFDLNAGDDDGKSLYLLAGSSVTVHFNTGALAGYEFTVAGYNSLTHTFTISPFRDENDYVYPSETDAAFQIAEGDKYVILGIRLPAEYIDTAEKTLAQKALLKYEECISRRYSYSLSLEEEFLKKYFPDGNAGHVFRVGDYIHITDPYMTQESEALRITAVSRDIYHEWKYSLTISDGTPSSLITDVVKNTVQMSQVIKQNKLTDVARSRRNARTTAEILDMTFDADGYFADGKIRPETVETIILNVGATSGQFVLDGVRMTANAGGFTSRFEFTDGVLSHFGIDKEKIMMWNMVGGTIYDLEEDRPYYIYARCEKNGDSGTVVADTAALRYDEDDDFYYFLTGILSSVEDGYRTLSASYGSTMINGRDIRTGRITSSNGTTYFDLDAGEMGGRIILSDESRTDAGETVISGGKINTSLIDTDTLVAKKIESREGTIADFTIQEKQLVGEGNKVVFSNETIPALEELLSKGDTTYPTGSANTASATGTSTMSEGVSELSMNVEIPDMEIPYAGMLTFRVKNTRGITWHDEGGMMSSDGSATVIRVQRANEDGSVSDVSAYTIEPNTLRTISAYIPSAGTYRIIGVSEHRTQSAWVESGNEQPFPTYTLDAGMEILGSATDGMIHLTGGQECTQIGTDGFYSFWSVINYLYFSQEEGLKFKGNFTAVSANGEYKLAITDGGIVITGDVALDYSTGKVLFDTATDRVNVESGESLGVLFGKVKKYFTDLKTVAFSGDYSDLVNTPVIPDVSGFLTPSQAQEILENYTYSKEEIQETYMSEEKAREILAGYYTQEYIDANIPLYEADENGTVDF